MVTPGAHAHSAYGGSASLDPGRRKAAPPYACPAEYSRIDPQCHITTTLWNNANYLIGKVAGTLQDSVISIFNFYFYFFKFSIFLVTQG